MIRIDPEKCVGCNACIRACPVNDANIAQTINGKNIISVNEKTVFIAENARKSVRIKHGILKMIPLAFLRI